MYILILEIGIYGFQILIMMTTLRDTMKYVGDSHVIRGQTCITQGYYIVHKGIRLQTYMYIYRDLIRSESEACGLREPGIQHIIIHNTYGALG